MTVYSKIPPRRAASMRQTVVAPYRRARNTVVTPGFKRFGLSFFRACGTEDEQRRHETCVYIRQCGNDPKKLIAGIKLLDVRLHSGKKLQGPIGRSRREDFDFDAEVGVTLRKVHNEQHTRPGTFYLSIDSIHTDRDNRWYSRQYRQQMPWITHGKPSVIQRAKLAGSRLSFHSRGRLEASPQLSCLCCSVLVLTHECTQPTYQLDSACRR